MDIGKASELFITKMKSKNWSEKTIKNYSCQLKLFLNYFKDRPKAKEISAKEIEYWLLKKININSRKHCRCSINAFYNLVIGQPEKLRFIPWPKKEERLIEYITQDEMQKLVSVCQNKKHKAIMCLMFGSGLRISEVINLRPEHIKSDVGIIEIIQGKGKKDRIVQLGEPLLKILREYWKEFNPKGGYLFNGQFEPQYSQRSINEFLKRYALAAGIKRNIHAHLLRHGFATTSLEMGTDIRYIQKLLGHNSIKTTIRYTHVSTNIVSKTPSPINCISL